MIYIVTHNAYVLKVYILNECYSSVNKSQLHPYLWHYISLFNDSTRYPAAYSNVKLNNPNPVIFYQIYTLPSVEECNFNQSKLQ